jgi:hypothetical protein
MELLTKKGCCTMGSKGDYYCVRCNWSGDHPEAPREKEKWNSCPVCRGHALPSSRKTGARKDNCACSG